MYQIIITNKHFVTASPHGEYGDWHAFVESRDLNGE